MKQKKVTFRLFLNKTLSPKNEIYYPVYFRITFNRQNTKIPDVLFNDHTLYWSKEELEAFENGFYSEKTRVVVDQVKQSMQFYEDVIRYEVQKNEEDYSIIGLAERARFYRQSFRNTFEEKLAYLKSMEVNIVRDPSSKGEAVSNFLGFPDEIEKHKDKLSKTFQRMQELATLLDLYGMPYYNEKLSNSFFADTVYYWEIKTGMREFQDFLLRYFDGKRDINEDYLNDRFENETPEHRYLLPIYRSLPPTADYKDLYFSLIKGHLQFLLHKV
jgi:hypothetical protein